jgi:hypothetical protein
MNIYICSGKYTPKRSLPLLLNFVHYLTFALDQNRFLLKVQTQLNKLKFKYQYENSNSFKLMSH